MSRSNASAVQRVSSVVALVVCFLLPLAAHAATDTVGTLTDSGPGSLRDAITNAHRCQATTISFQAGLTGTITLASTLTIAENLTIQGPGANVITVSGNNAVQVFNVTGGTITISGLTIANGLGAPGSGGGAPFGGGIANTGIADGERRYLLRQYCLGYWRQRQGHQQQWGHTGRNQQHLHRQFRGQ